MIKIIFFISIIFFSSTIFAENLYLENSIKDFIISKIGVCDSIKISINNRKNWDLKNINKIIKINLLSKRFYKTNKIRVIYQNKNLENRYTLISFNCAIYKQVLISKKTINKNEIFSNNNLKFISKDITILHNYYNKNITPNRYIAKTDIKANSVITSNMIMLKPDVEKFSQINVIYDNNKVKISFKAIALQNGKIDDKILFKSLIDKKIKKGIVIASNTVKLEI